MPALIGWLCGCCLALGSLESAIRRGDPWSSPCVEFVSDGIASGTPLDRREPVSSVVVCSKHPGWLPGLFCYVHSARALRG